jgi:hypothetical protein
VAVLSAITFGQRIYAVRKATTSKDAMPKNENENAGAQKV